MSGWNRYCHLAKKSSCIKKTWTTFLLWWTTSSSGHSNYNNSKGERKTWTFEPPVCCNGHTSYLNDRFRCFGISMMCWKNKHSDIRQIGPMFLLCCLVSGLYYLIASFKRWQEIKCFLPSFFDWGYQRHNQGATCSRHKLRVRCLKFVAQARSLESWVKVWMSL